MEAVFTEEQQALADAARGLASGGLAAARACLNGAEPPAEPTRSLLRDFAGLAVPEDRGGLGGTLVDLAIVVEALGAQVTPTPFVSHVLAVQLVDGSFGVRPEAVAGALRWALAADGDLRAVRDGVGADAVVVIGDAGLDVSDVTSADARPSFDPTRPLAMVVTGDGFGFDGPPAPAALARGTQRATAVLAAELCGVARGALELAVGYAKQREQFGQPIGRFQGIAHQLADVFTAIDAAWSLALYACWAVQEGHPDAAWAVHAAKAKAGAAAVAAAERGTQVHGGIGITWEADPHLYLRRAIADDAWLGNHRWHEQQVGRLAVTG